MSTTTSVEKVKITYWGGKVEQPEDNKKRSDGKAPITFWGGKWRQLEHDTDVATEMGGEELENGRRSSRAGEAPRRKTDWRSKEAI